MIVLRCATTSRLVHHLWQPRDSAGLVVAQHTCHIRHVARADVPGLIWSMECFVKVTPALTALFRLVAKYIK